MTEKEAMGYLQTLANRIPLKFYTDKGYQVYDDFSQIAIKALEKQIPKEPIPQDEDCLECPNCDSFIGYASDKDEHYRVEYCPNCGQALKWE